jgi:glycine dehydrogenase subunit 1
MHATRRDAKIVVPANVHPEFRQILATYFANQSTEIVPLATPEGIVSAEDLQRVLDDQTACVLLQQPSFFGTVQPLDEIADLVHRAGALLAVSVDPISLGILKRPGDYGADVVIAEGQSLGSPMNFGGPYLGIMACREPFVRRMPGRIAGQTVDRQGRRCWVLTLQTREQHIRREKATSNICTNQGLFALRAAVYLAMMGPEGLRQTAELCLHKARYAIDRITAGDQWTLALDQPTFKEFAVRAKSGDVESVCRAAQRAGIHAGVPLGRWVPEMADCLLVAVTEKRTKADIDRLVACLTESSSPVAAAHA